MKTNLARTIEFSLVLGLFLLLTSCAPGSSLMDTPTPEPSPTGTATQTPMPTASLPPTGTATQAPAPSATFTPTSAPTDTATVTLTPTPTATLAPGTIANFDNGVTGWQVAPKGVDGWSNDESGISVMPSKEKSSEAGALWANFNFADGGQYPRATFYLKYDRVQDWSTYKALWFDAKSLDQNAGRVKATIVIRTGANSCFYESGSFLDVGSAWNTLKFNLDEKKYKTCQPGSNYTNTLLDRNMVDTVEIVFIPIPNNGKFAGAVLIDNVHLVSQP